MKKEAIALKQWIKSALYVPEHSKPTDKKIRRLLLPSFLGIILCMFLLAGTTWAWFSASVQTQPQTIAAANYDITVLIEDENSQPLEKTEKGYLLSENTEYTVTLTAKGTASSGGYCKVEGGEKSLYTKQILPGDTLSFKFIPSVTANYTFTAMWGSYSGEPNITENCTIGQRMEVQRVPEVSEPQQNSSGRKDVHIVQAEDSLWGIAAQYGTTVEKITAYNDIAQDAALQIGQEIKIPPQDYEIPSDPSSSSTLPEESSSIPEGAAESQEDDSAETSSISE
jgi:predicted ribosomally synthesized peptide with SipW-like signal peptide